MGAGPSASAGFFNRSNLKSGVTVTDIVLGHGRCTDVLQLEYMGLKCAGRKIREACLQEQEGGYSYAVHRLEEEFYLLSQVRHPNIVQFLGVHFQQGVPAPILVMEFLPTNLTSYIDQYGILPKEISYSILHDVALGLCYLHSQTPPIIHRDLSSNNVLLTPNMTAKISDLGVARILNLTPQRAQDARSNSASAYLPPEVKTYVTSVDIFSYGILMIHIFSGRWPEPQVGETRFDRRRVVTVIEAERREVFLRAIGNDHPLMDLILVCVDNHPQLRPHASVIVKRLADRMSQFSPASFANRLEMLRQIDQLREKKQKLWREIEFVEKENEKMKEDIHKKKVQLHQVEEKCFASDDLNSQLQKEIQKKNDKIEFLNTENSSQKKNFALEVETLETRYAHEKRLLHKEVEELKSQIEKMEEEIQKKNDKIEFLNTENSSQKKNFQLEVETLETRYAHEKRLLHKEVEELKSQIGKMEEEIQENEKLTAIYARKFPY